MAAKEKIQAVTLAILHLRDCTIRPTQSCKECMQMSVRLATVLTEGMEAAEALKLLLRTSPMAAKMAAGAGAPTPPGNLPLGAGTPLHLRP